MHLRFLMTIPLLISILVTSSMGLPQFSLLTGNRCVNCHVNVQGGGIRNELGWYAMEGVGLLRYEDVGLGLFKPILSTNTLFDGRLTVGADFRLQSSRSLRDTSAQRRIFPMQGAFYAAFKPSEWFTVEGTFNLGRRVFAYAGQQLWSASVLIQPNLDYPQLRVGFFQPSIGYRFDDHTMLIRRIPAGSQDYLFAPNWAEWGAELNYYRIEWLTVTAGVATLTGLRDARILLPSGDERPLVRQPTKPAAIGRVLFSPRFFRERLTLNLGSSTMQQGDFSLWNVFGGIGYADIAALIVETMRQNSGSDRTITATTAELMLHIAEPVYLYARAEQGETVTAGTSLRQQQYLLGAQVFVLPFVELRPEYRIIDLPLYRLNRWTVQLHVFY
ncbi:MAG: hypothetical protein N2971_08525 [Chlorobi bacterium]|nr:hypothetical protein [Chlorobiota bacterium]